MAEYTEGFTLVGVAPRRLMVKLGLMVKLRVIVKLGVTARERERLLPGCPPLALLQGVLPRCRTKTGFSRSWVLRCCESRTGYENVLVRTRIGYERCCSSTTARVRVQDCTWWLVSRVQDCMELRE